MKLLNILLTCAPFANALWPIPSSYTNGTSVLFIEKNSRITYNGQDIVLVSSNPPFSAMQVLTLRCS